MREIHLQLWKRDLGGGSSHSAKRSNTPPTFSLRTLDACNCMLRTSTSRDRSLLRVPLRRTAAHHPSQGADPRPPLQHARSRHGNVSRSDALLQLEPSPHGAADEGSCGSLVRQLAHVRVDGEGGNFWLIDVVRSVRTH